jgi:hypothetical protein
MHFQEFGETEYRGMKVLGLVLLVYGRMHLFGWRTGSSERQPSFSGIAYTGSLYGTKLAFE